MNYTSFISYLKREMYKFALKEPLRNHTSMQIGGPADIYIEIESIRDLCNILRKIEEYNIPFFLIGNGTNLIVSDDGFNGVIIKLTGDFQKIIVNGSNVTCGAGVKLIDLCKFALHNSLSGLEFAYGIPGTCGGAVYMNAGAYGGEFKDIVHRVHCIDNNYNEVYLSPEECAFSYRKSIFSENKMIILSAEVSLKNGNFNDIKDRMNDIMNRRIEKQPLNYPSAGSTFKRPEGYFVGPLIQECGLQGMSVGDALVSTKHAGFIVNTGNASCSDVMSLVNKIQHEVYNKFKVNLELEPIYLSNNENNNLEINLLKRNNLDYSTINQEFGRNI